MNIEILELEQILNKEMEAYSKLEEYISGKNNCLVKGEMEKVKTIDEELEKYNYIVGKLEQKRQQFYPENVTLKQIIEKIEDKEQAERLSSLRRKIKDILLNVQKQSTISSELLKHSMKIVENSITVIANALIPEGSAYNQKGVYKTSKELYNISSIDHEV